jgi:lipopolysaccharide/colanic/teichoic acid biosynthesis glycosyltransferase
MGEYTVDTDLALDPASRKWRIRDNWIIRVSDIILSVLGLIILSPLFGILVILIKLESAGRAFFRQERVGMNGKIFRMYKFRSMCHNADRMPHQYRVNDKGIVEPVITMRNDNRVTRVGKYLRRYGLDEFPQLINVFKGDMSLVGPRPHVLAEFELYSDYHKRRLKVKPGVTGLTQVAKATDKLDLPFDRKVELDIYYIQHKSATLYYKTILRTIPSLFSNSGNY